MYYKIKLKIISNKVTYIQYIFIIFIFYEK